MSVEEIERGMLLHPSNLAYFVFKDALLVIRKTTGRTVFKREEKGMLLVTTSLGYIYKISTLA